MRIGVVTGTFHPEAGGPPTYLYHLLPDLIARGHSVRVLTMGEPFDHDYGYPVTRISRQQSRPLRFIRFIRAMLRLARDVDVLFVNGYALPLLIVRWLTRRRIVLKVVGDFSWEFAYRNHLTTLDPVEFQNAPKPLTLRLLRALYLRAVGLAQVVIVPSEHLARIVRGWGIPAERLRVIYNGIPDPALHEVDRAGLRADLNLAPDHQYLVYITRLTPLKGTHIAVQALHHLPDHVHLLIIGDGDQRPDLEQIAPAGRVHFIGYLPHDQALRYLRAADVFVLSSFTEGLSHVLLEAQIVGTPAVVTQVGGNPEIVSDGINGLLVPPGDPPALAEAIRRILTDPTFAAQLAAAGRTRSQDFAWTTTVARTEALLQAFANAHEHHPRF